MLIHQIRIKKIITYQYQVKENKNNNSLLKRNKKLIKFIKNTRIKRNKNNENNKYHFQLKT